MTTITRTHKQRPHSQRKTITAEQLGNAQIIARAIAASLDVNPADVASILVSHTAVVIETKTAGDTVATVYQVR